MDNHANAPSVRLYLWVPRSELAYLQGIVDASEGLGRIRTERHHHDRSLILFLTTHDQLENVRDFLRHIERELATNFEFV